MLLGFNIRYDPFALLVLGLLLDALIGDPPWLFKRLLHPVALMGGFIGWLDRRFNKAAATPGARRFAGKLVCFANILVAGAVGAVLSWVFAQTVLQFPLEGITIALLLSGRGLYDHVAAVAKALEAEGLAAGREAVRHIVGRDPASLDAPGVARAAIESLAENFTDGVVAPALWYAFFGLPGLFAYKALNTADSMIGHTSKRYLDFGRATARLDDLANLLPARVAGQLFVGAAWLVKGADGGGGYRAMLRDAPKHRSPNAGWTEAAVAGALNLALNGPRAYGGEVEDDPWMGEGRKEAGSADIRRALVLYLHAAGLFTLFALVSVWLYR